MSNPTDSFRNPSRYLGQDYRFVPTYIRPRDPHSPTNASNDIKPKEQQGYYPVTSLWTNSSSGNIWALAKITNNLASWILISGGSSGPMLQVTVPNGVTPIVPDTLGNMNFTSSLGTITITGSSASPNNHTINFDLPGGGVAVDQINVDAHTAPGTDPVVPVPATGEIIITGGQVATGVIGANVIRTDSLAANTFTIEIQRTTAVAGTDSTKNGVSHFDSARFTVDANGFVSINGSGIGETITGDSGGALSPTAGNWNILGGPGVTTSGSGSTLTINSVIFTDTTATTLVSDNGYFATAAGTYVLPATPLQGELIHVVCDTAGAVVVDAPSTHLIRIGNQITSAGGTLTSTAIGDSLTLRYRSSSTTWFVTASMGNWTVA